MSTPFNLRNALIMLCGLLLIFSADWSFTTKSFAINLKASSNDQNTDAIVSPASQTANGVVVSPDAHALAEAMDIDPDTILDVAIGHSDSYATGIALSRISYFPVQGNSFGILSTGKAESINTPNSSEQTSAILTGLKNTQGNDLTQLRISVRVPQDVNCAAVDFAFYTEEYAEFTNTLYNDVFTAGVGGTNLSISGPNVVSPLNFAFTPDGDFISSQTSFGLHGDTGTTFDGATPMLTARTPVTPGATTEFVFSIQDLGDPIYDSAVFLDNFRWEKRDDCIRGSEAIYHVHLPIIANTQVVTEEAKPDLIGSFSIEPNKQRFDAGEAVTVTVVITNQGSDAASPFWTDLFINPSMPPATANSTWSKVCSLSPCLGIAWSVPGLATGQSITLTSTTDSFAKAYTQWPGWFAVGTTDLYLYVDSYNLASPTGAVLEADETNNRYELHGFTVIGVNPAEVIEPINGEVDTRPMQ